MRLSEMQSKKIIDITTGSNIGVIMDIVINKEGKIESIVVEQEKTFFAINKDNSIVILWENITKIGEDVILIKRD